jgi:hypothetical protein
VCAGVPTTALGMVSVHDHKVAPRSLVLCRGSMARVPAAGAAAYQETLPGTAEGADGDSGFVQDGIF